MHNVQDSLPSHRASTGSSARHEIIDWASTAQWLRPEGYRSKSSKHPSTYFHTSSDVAHVPVTSLADATKHPREAAYGVLFGSQLERYSPSQGESRSQLGPLHPQSGSREMNASSQLAFFFLCSRESSCGMALSTFRVHLPSSVKRSWYPY